MATQPNYFYNSPWIADAARNLASAFAPPDPQQLLARERAQWEFERAKQLAGVADEERAINLAAEQALSELALDEPAVNPVTGEVDEKQTGINRRGIAARAYKGGREFVDPTNKLLGQYSPTFESESMIAALKAAAQGEAIAQRGENAMDLARYVQGQIGQRQQNMFGHQWDMQQYKTSAQFAMRNADAQRRMAEIQERGRLANVNPKAINGRILEDIVVYLDTREMESGKRLPKSAYQELLTRASIEAARNGGNVPVAVSQVWSDAGLDDEGAPVDAKPTWWQRTFGGAPEYLKPNFGERPTPLMPSAGGSQYRRELGTAVTPAAGPPLDASTLPLPTGVPRLGEVVTPPPVEDVGPPPPAAAPPPPAPKPKAETKPNAKPPRVPRGSADLPQPKNKQEYDKLPKGARFLDPQGKVRVKP
jgi:hypothetical protein